MSAVTANPTAMPEILLAGSIRSLSAETCKEREVNFFAFNVLEGLDEFTVQKDSRDRKPLAIKEYGFKICPFYSIIPGCNRIRAGEPDQYSRGAC